MSLLNPLLDLIFPDRCVNCGSVGNYFCSNCSLLIKPIEVQICPYCKRAAIGGKTHPVCAKKYGLDGLSSGFYHQGPIKKAVHLLKYKLITNLQRQLTTLLLVSLANQEVGFQDFVMVPIPLFQTRERKRGFNQAMVISSPLAKEWGLKLSQHGLKRIRNTKPQVGLTEKERQENLRAAFVVGEGLKGSKVVLVDDVFTTGATMLAASQVLKKAGVAEVWALTLARAQNY